jgi:hypothetical protein
VRPTSGPRSSALLVLGPSRRIARPCLDPVPGPHLHLVQSPSCHPTPLLTPGIPSDAAAGMTASPPTRSDVCLTVYSSSRRVQLWSEFRAASLSNQAWTGSRTSACTTVDGDLRPAAFFFRPGHDQRQLCVRALPSVILIDVESIGVARLYVAGVLLHSLVFSNASGGSAQPASLHRPDNAWGTTMVHNNETGQ